MDTWDKKVKVNKKSIEKKKVLDYYKSLWKKDKAFRDTVKKKGIFVRSSFGNKSVIRRKGIKINNIKDLEKVVRERAVEFIISTNKTKYKSLLDIDLPKRHVQNKKKISRRIIDKLKKKKISIALVTDSPSGAHIFSNSSKNALKKAVKEIEKEDKQYHVGKTSSNKIVLDPSEPNVVIPGSLSIKGGPYKKWK